MPLQLTRNSGDKEKTREAEKKDNSPSDNSFRKAAMGYNMDDVNRYIGNLMTKNKKTELEYNDKLAKAVEELKVKAGEEAKKLEEKINQQCEVKIMELRKQVLDERRQVAKFDKEAAKATMELKKRIREIEQLKALIANKNEIIKKTYINSYELKNAEYTAAVKANEVIDSGAEQADMLVAHAKEYAKQTIEAADKYKSDVIAKLAELSAQLVSAKEAFTAGITAVDGAFNTASEQAGEYSRDANIAASYELAQLDEFKPLEPVHFDVEELPPDENAPDFSDELAEILDDDAILTSFTAPEAEESESDVSFEISEEGMSAEEELASISVDGDLLTATEPIEPVEPAQTETFEPEEAVAEPAAPVNDTIPVTDDLAAFMEPVKTEPESVYIEEAPASSSKIDIPDDLAAFMEPVPEAPKHEPVKETALDDDIAAALADADFLMAPSKPVEEEKAPSAPEAPAKSESFGFDDLFVTTPADVADNSMDSNVPLVNPELLSKVGADDFVLPEEEPKAEAGDDIEIAPIDKTEEPPKGGDLGADLYEMMIDPEKQAELDIKPLEPEKDEKPQEFADFEAFLAADDTKGEQLKPKVVDDAGSLWDFDIGEESSEDDDMSSDNNGLSDLMI